MDDETYRSIVAGTFVFVLVVLAFMGIGQIWSYTTAEWEDPTWLSLNNSASPPWEACNGEPTVPQNESEICTNVTTNTSNIVVGFVEMS